MRILLIRTSALGDVVHCLPVLRALRARYPGATIGWVIERRFSPLLTSDPDLDAILEIDLRQWRRSLFRLGAHRDLIRSLAAIRDFDADVVLDLMGNHKAGALAAATFCDRRIGLARSYRREPSSALWLSEWAKPHAPHSVDRALAIAAVIGADTQTPDFGATQLRRAGDYPAALAARNSPYVVIHPGAAWPNKRYPPEAWGRVAAGLRTETGWDTLVSVGPTEQALGERLVEAAGGAAQLATADSLAALVTLLDRARLVAAGDTGPLHLAHALETPVLAVMGPTDPRIHGPYRALSNVIWKQLPGSFSHRRFSKPEKCLLELAPEEIVGKALEILALGRLSVAPTALET